MDRLMPIIGLERMSTQWDTQIAGKDLAQKVLNDGAGKRYAISKTGWSFYWVRSKSDPESSDLIYSLKFQQKKI